MEKIKLKPCPFCGERGCIVTYVDAVRAIREAKDSETIVRILFTVRKENTITNAQYRRLGHVLAQERLRQLRGENV